MLTQTVENGISMCSEYFPSDPDIPTTSYVDNESGDQFTAIVSDRAVHSGEPQEVLSTMELNVDRKSETQLKPNERQANEEQLVVTSKEVLHYQFIAWPVSRLPEGDDREALIRFSGASRGAEEDRDGSPRIVHSHDGSGRTRTGTFIALDFLLGEVEDGAMEEKDAQTTDMIFDTVDSLKKQRLRMVEDLQSYEFLYETIKEDLKRKLNLDAKQSFLARWSKVLIFASVRQSNYENGIFWIDGSSMDGIYRSISRSIQDLCDLQDRLELKFPGEEHLSRTRRSLSKLLEASRKSPQWVKNSLRGKGPDLHVIVNLHVQALISSPPKIFTSTENLEFFAPWQRDLARLQQGMPGEESVERIKNEEDEGVRHRTEADLLADPLKAGYSGPLIVKHNNKDNARPVGIKPTYIKVHRKHLSVETLDVYGLPWELDRVSYTDVESVVTTADST